MDLVGDIAVIVVNERGRRGGTVGGEGWTLSLVGRPSFRRPMRGTKSDDHRRLGKAAPRITSPATAITRSHM